MKGMKMVALHPYATSEDRAWLRAYRKWVEEQVGHPIEIHRRAGIVGNAASLPHCSQEQFSEAGYCPPDTQVGVVNNELFFFGPSFRLDPIYNLTPPPGQGSLF